MTLVTRETLFDFRDLEQGISLDDAAEFSDERDMPGDVSPEFPKFGIFLNEFLHVGNRRDGRRVMMGRFGLKVRHIGREGSSKIAKIGEDVVREERVRSRDKHDVLIARLKIDSQRV